MWAWLSAHHSRLAREDPQGLCVEDAVKLSQPHLSTAHSALFSASGARQGRAPWPFSLLVGAHVTCLPNMKGLVLRCDAGNSDRTDTCFEKVLYLACPIIRKG